MGRPSKLTEKQWDEIGRRLVDGEAARSLAREFGVSEAAVRKRVGTQTAQIKTVANQMVAAEVAFNALPVSAQISAQNLANKLRSISDHLAGAANYGAATAHRLAGLAHAKVQEIDGAAPLDAKSLESLKGVAVLTKMSNDAAATGLNLLNANKETVKSLEESDESPPSLEDFYGGLPKPEPSPA